MTRQNARNHSRTGKRPNIANAAMPTVIADAPRYSRRTLLLTVATGAALAGCAPFVAHQAPPTPTPFVLRRPATLFADATVPQALANTAVLYLEGQAGISSVTPVKSLDETPDLVLTFGAPPPRYTVIPAYSSPLTAISDLRTPVDSISASQMRTLLNGTTNDWQSVGAPYSMPVHLHVLAGLSLPSTVQISSSATTHTTLVALLNAVSGTPGSLAVIPMEAANWIVKNIGVDSLYPAQGRGDTTKATLAPFMLKLCVAQGLVRQGLDLHKLSAVLSAGFRMPTPTLDMIVVGDIMLGRGVNNQMVGHNDYLYPYRKIHDEMLTADLRVANLECTVTDLVPVPTDSSTFTFVSSKRAVDGLIYAGLDAVTVANNHSNGSGEPAFLDMLHTLTSHNIKVCGGGNTLNEARQPAILTAKGLRVALLGYDVIAPQGPFATPTSSGLAPIDLDTLPADIAAARKQADLVMPYFHWGIEYTKDPTIDQQHIAHAAIDAGADIVLGNHPHWTQAIEEYKGKLIIYSFGNFIFDQDWSRPTLESMLIHFYWRGATLAGIRFVPTIDENRCQPRIQTPAEAVGVFERMWSGTDMLARGQYGPEPE